MSARALRPRLLVAHGLFKGPMLLRYFALAILPPTQILERIKRYYERQCEHWSSEVAVARGFNRFEEELLARELREPCDLLIVGCGGGREALAFAARGFRVVGVDMVEAMVERARQHAAWRGLNAAFLTQDISTLQSLPGTFDCALFTTEWLYEQIPSRRLRVQALRSARTVLREGGRVIFNFHLTQPMTQERWLFPLLRAAAFLSHGNREYQMGDRPAAPLGFIHAFAHPEEVRAECRDAGFESVSLQFFEEPWGGYAVGRLRAAVHEPAAGVAR